MACCQGEVIQVEGTMPPAAMAAAAKLPEALEAAAKKQGVACRATLFNPKLEVMHTINMDGVPGMMLKIAQSKARSCFDGKELGAPGIAETMFSYMIPWMLGLTDQMAVKGSLLVQLPGIPEKMCFVVNGAPDANQDQTINEECLIACGFQKDPSTGVFVLK
eukprot:TRINITY_DN75786_c0_g1_i1.p1 TRINITY_DN75786_c0_g1~~TRINITY_DN75786_c0_g1_i1.p1  ORF type:complete len:183 (-),score=38.74 TRINITY_DN75786_c0_g1_i1:137-622(-)